MGKTISEKLRIKPGYTILTIDAPPGFKKSLDGMPDGVKIVTTGKSYDQVHWFVRNRAEMEKELKRIIGLVKEQVICWIYYPKGSSGLQTDLTRDKGWDALLGHNEFQWISLISFDDTWSTFAFRLKTEADKKKETRPAEREIFKWVDPETKAVKLPDDFASALNKNKKQAEFFKTLSFTNKKEYLEWIVTAKREETRKERIAGSIERLGKNWKNPRNT
jgi:hypothetical protein